ncbi:MAG: glycerophosphodiester phosphodiesterase [Alphaproteobacteria bacterium HGW-Alphaproteobacteria-12]|nr:MAG: glycerophosphodiester phosphodiesterase [Alphaproteobacteria bacterium HGW-Alphaproteobacteria-12]
MPAFQGAVDLGYCYVETDAHATRDGVVLAFHDDKLDRTTDGTGIIAEMDYDDVRKARIGGTEPIPLMAELLSAWPDLRINIDPKRNNVVEPLIGLLRDMNATERVCVTSFSDRRTAIFRQALGPGLCTGMGPISTGRLRFASWMGPFGFVMGGFTEGCAQIPIQQYGITLADRSLVSRAHELGLQVHVWTIDDPVEMHRLIDLDVDGIMTDEPALLKTVLIERGRWSS